MKAEYNHWYKCQEGQMPEDFENGIITDSLGYRLSSRSLIIATQCHGPGAFDTILHHWGHRKRFLKGEAKEYISKLPFEWEEYGHPLQQQYI